MAEENENNLNHEEIEEVEASIVDGDDSKTEVTEEEFAQFIGTNADKYFKKFGKFNVDGNDMFAVTWNWPAFFFSYVWMAYRKMYIWAVCAVIIIFLYVIGTFLFEYLVVSHIPSEVLEGLAHLGILPLALLIAFIFPMIAFGVAGNYIYYRFCRKKIIEWKNADRSIPLAKRGGVNPWAAVVAIIISFILELF